MDILASLLTFQGNIIAIVVIDRFQSQDILGCFLLIYSLQGDGSFSNMVYKLHGYPKSIIIPSKTIIKITSL